MDIFLSGDWIQKNFPLSLVYVPDRFKTQEIYNEAVHNRLCMMLFVPDHLWPQEMCNEIMHTMPNAFHHLPDHFKTKICIKAVELDPSFLQLVPDHFKTQEICDKPVKLTLLLYSLSQIGLLQRSG